LKASLVDLCAGSTVDPFSQLFAFIMHGRMRFEIKIRPDLFALLAIRCSTSYQCTRMFRTSDIERE